jgi:hypothetical protein
VSTEFSGDGRVHWNAMGRDAAIVEWLLDGDPAIRWQVHRDLLGRPPLAVAAERSRVSREGWGRRLLDRQASDGRWVPDRGPARFRGLYVPKWTSTTYTMSLLSKIGVPPDDAKARRGCHALVSGAEWFPSGGLGYFDARRTAEHCVSAIVLGVLETFDAESRARSRLARFLLDTQLPDGGWNCMEDATHGSFNTTTLALEALLPRARARPVADALARGREFLCSHRLYRSHRTGRIVRSSFTRLRWPIGWEADVLRQLDHFAAARAPRDPRLAEPIDRIRRHRRSDGRWACTSRQPGAVHFELERAGKPSRWVTLKCLRILKWWDDA